MPGSNHSWLPHGKHLLREWLCGHKEPGPRRSSKSTACSSSGSCWPHGTHFQHEPSSIPDLIPALLFGRPKVAGSPWLWISTQLKCLFTETVLKLSASKFCVVFTNNSCPQKYFHPQVRAALKDWKQPSFWPALSCLQKKKKALTKSK